MKCSRVIPKWIFRFGLSWLHTWSKEKRLDVKKIYPKTAHERNHRVAITMNVKTWSSFASVPRVNVQNVRRLLSSLRARWTGRLNHVSWAKIIWLDVENNAQKKKKEYVCTLLDDTLTLIREAMQGMLVLGLWRKTAEFKFRIRTEFSPNAIDVGFHK